MNARSIIESFAASILTANSGARRSRSPVSVAKLGAVLAASFCAMAIPLHAMEGKKVTLTGEMIDTWCYVSQIMGPSKAATGTSHHVCAVWCAAGGIPVGLLEKETDKVYMVLSFEGNDTSVANEEVLNLQSHELTVTGTAFELDGLNYLNIDSVVKDEGVTNLTHEMFGIIPGAARP